MPANTQQFVEGQQQQQAEGCSPPAEGPPPLVEDDPCWDEKKKPLSRQHSADSADDGVVEDEESVGGGTSDPEWFVSHPDERRHGEFVRRAAELIIARAVFDGTSREHRVTEWRDPAELERLLRLRPGDEPESQERLLERVAEVIKYSVKTGHPRFVNQLFSAVDPYALVGQWLGDALNPSVYTYEVAPVFVLMEETLLREMRRIVGFPDDGAGDGIFCPGGSMANGYAISCARHYKYPEIKSKGLQRPLALFTSEDAHYSVRKLASFMGLGADNVYAVRTDRRGRLDVAHLRDQVQCARAAGAEPFMVSATAGTTVRGAFDPIEDIADVCEAESMWLHVDAAWGGGALVSRKHRGLLKGVERADSVTWNPHKLLTAPQQCSTLLLRHQGLLSAAHSASASYLFQKDKFYDTQHDTGDKHIQCGRRVDVLKFWLMWCAKGSRGLELHVDRAFENARHFAELVRERDGFELVFGDEAPPECTNVCFWYVPPSLRDAADARASNYSERLHLVAPKIKERMMRAGTMMCTYQPHGALPNFFRIVFQSSAIGPDDVRFFVDEIERLGADL